MSELKIEKDKDGKYVIPGDEDATQWLQEAMTAIAKQNGLPTDENGMPKIVVAPRLHRWWFTTKVRFLHAIGLHHYVGVTEYDAPTGSMKFGGSRCLVCGKR